ncbi:MAG TPA: transposase [Accumulibacter sp.]|nr:transposase [Accumulibacter sp.]
MKILTVKACSGLLMLFCGLSSASASQAETQWVGRFSENFVPGVARIPAPWRSGWGLHKKPADWTVKQTETMHGLQRSNLKTARAWRIKQALRSIYATATTPDEAKPLLKRWLSWASRCRLEPFKRLGRTITNPLPGVLNGFQADKHNGRGRSDESSPSGGARTGARLSPRRKLHRYGLPHRRETL